MLIQIRKIYPFNMWNKIYYHKKKIIFHFQKSDPTVTTEKSSFSGPICKIVINLPLYISTVNLWNHKIYIYITKLKRFVLR